jgi:alpha-tubulin suppressor-like RCC1 family protein
LVLNHVPAVGASYMVVKNTGPNLLRGAFDNLAQGQLVQLNYQNVSYPFVVNYFGGTGNDLVLRWANTRLLGWGANDYDQLGNGGSSGNTSIAGPVYMTGVLSGKVVTKVAAGGKHSLALAADGTVAAWGQNIYNQLGTDTYVSSELPVEVGTTGVLAGKQVIDVAAGGQHSLALGADGTLAAWGVNNSGQLGDGTTSRGATPVLVRTTGVLAGRTVVAVAAGGAHSLALCADGTVAAWGSNSSGQLGNGSTVSSNVPVWVNQTGVLAGKTVVSVVAGSNYSMALCADGTLAAWGEGGSGSLGNNTTVTSSVPVLVDRTGVLAGKTITAIATGAQHGMALCADGTLALWGSNGHGQLGDNTTTSKSLPVLVNRTGALLGKTIIGIGAGDYFSLARCADGTLAEWGNNSSGQLGNTTTTNSSVPVLVDTTALRAGESLVAAIGGGAHSLAVVAIPPPPVVTTLAASGMLDTGAVLHGTLNANGLSTSVAFEYGMTTAYGTVVSAVPAAVTLAGATAASATLSGLQSGTIYHFRMLATSMAGTAKGEDMTFTTSSVASLASLSTDGGSLVPAFHPAILDYAVTVPATTTSIRLTPVMADASTTLTVNGSAAASGAPTAPIDLAVGNIEITLAVAYADGSYTTPYTVTVTRLPETLTFNSAAEAAITAPGLMATGHSVTFALNHAPATGAELMVVRNTGTYPIRGSFTNLAHGQVVALNYGGINYAFRADYYGGTGNDLVLRWANTRLFGWGSDFYGQLCDGKSDTSLATPTPLAVTGVLAGRTVTRMATGADHSLLLCADGTLVTGGRNDAGELGVGNQNSGASNGPRLVDQTGVLAGKTIVAIAASHSHSLALCSDGTLTAWGANGSGALGDGSTTSRWAPVMVDQTGVLANKSVVAIAAGASHSLVLCGDGTLATWGTNHGGLVVDSVAKNLVPALVRRDGALAGKTVTAIAAGDTHSLALCADGTVVAWGTNTYGELGSNSTAITRVPVAVDRSELLANRAVMAIAAGPSRSFALCADGTIAAWGANGGNLGTGDTANSSVPVPVYRGGALAGRTVTGIFCRQNQAFAVCSDATVVAWPTSNSANTFNQPMVLGSGALAAGERFVTGVSGSASTHSFALVALPPAPAVQTLAASAVGGTSAILNGGVSAQSTPASVSFEVGLTDLYGLTVAGTPDTVTGIASTAVSAQLNGLLSGTTYHYRVVAVNTGGTTKGEDQVFTTGTGSSLAGLTLNSGPLYPTFSSPRTSYLATVPHTVSSIAVTPVGNDTAATIKVNGIVVASGMASDAISLAVGENVIATEVTAATGIDTQTYTVRVVRLPDGFEFNAATDVPVTVGGLWATGATPTLSLKFAPPPGITLTLVRNTGTDWIEGSFADLAQGQRVDLTYNGTSYPFVVNYHGGTGNDLVLQWANTRLLGFGNGKLVPTAVDATGVLWGRTILAVATGAQHSIALCDDGSLVGWGSNGSGQLGDGSASNRDRPTWVDQSGVLAGKTVVAVAAGTAHSLVLCDDGTLAAWGYGNYGTLGNDSITSSNVPVLVNTGGVLAGKRVVAIAAGAYHNLALCADGTLATWGRNPYGQLGNDTTTNSLVPVLVDQTGILAGKTITAIAAGFSHSLVLCADGSLAAWGANDGNQLGDNSAIQSKVPVLVRNGSLAGKTVVGIAAGSLHNLARCADGTIAAWGTNASGQLGNNSTLNGRVPGAVSLSGVLSGKVIVDIAAGEAHSLAVAADGTLAGWGSNTSGRLGNNSTTASLVPVSAAAGALIASERVIAGWAGQAHSLILAAAPPPPVVITQEPTDLLDHAATLNGSVNANGPDAAVSFDYGLTAAYGSQVAAVPGTVGGNTATPASATIGGLSPGVTYHYRVVAGNAYGTTLGEDRTFTTTTFGALAGLTLSHGTLAPGFAGSQPDYLATVPFAVGAITVTPTAAHAGAVIAVNGMAVASGNSSPPIELAVGDNPIAVAVTAADGINALTYHIRVTRLPASLVFNSAADVLLTADDLVASGISLRVTLNFAPAPGTRLTVVNLTGPQPLRGVFDNLAHGQVVGLDYGGTTYHFVVNYFGGNGNDLELEWLNSRVVAWGANGDWQLGNNSNTNSTVPVPVEMSGALAGKPVIDLGVGGSSSSPFSNHSFAVAADGSLAAWGSSGSGALGLGTTTSGRVPLEVPRTGGLAGKQVAAMASGTNFALARCTDGTMVAWGYNYYGQLGNDSQATSQVPVAVVGKGALLGKFVVDIAAGENHCLAVCSDGTVVAWGGNSAGQLGNGGTTSSSVPIRVEGLPVGRKFVAVAAGSNFSLALGDDGRVYAWGYNNSGQLGNNSTSVSAVPVPVDATGVLAGKPVVAIAAGVSHGLALGADGSIAAWGSNASGQLGNNSTTNSSVPVAVDRSGPLAASSVREISAIRSTSFALCADGTLAAWGGYSLVGNDSTANSKAPVAAVTSSLRAGETFMRIGSGTNAGHALAVTALPLQAAASLAATSITGVSGILNGSVNARENAITVAFEYGLDETYGNSLAATPAAAAGTSATAVSAALGGLTPGTTYHYRVVTTSYGGIVRSADMTFTTLSDNAKLAALGHDGGVIAPGFEKQRFGYLSSVPFETAAVTVSAVADHPRATITVNGGSAATPLALTVGNNLITVSVTAEDGISTESYLIAVNRLPQEFVFNAASDIPLTSDGFAAGGNPVRVVLGFAPAPGTVLTMVNNTGLGFTYGRFANLAQGQRVSLTYSGTNYDFIANYHGGTGNDLVLQWANTELLAWGGNGFGQLGDDTTTERRLLPTPVNAAGVLADKVVLAVAGGYLHSLALCADGTLAAWGYNAFGQLGNNAPANSPIPVAVDQTGALAGKSVVAIAAGPFHNLALCEDGTLVAWGYNNHGQLGDGTKVTRRAPVAVARVGALATLQVVAVAAGAYQSFALGADGTVAAWGYNDEGELGDGTTTGSLIPVAVDRSGALAGKRVARLAAGQYHTLGLCTDGTLVTWGYNKTGQLGNHRTTAAAAPVAIGGEGALAGKTPVGIRAGGYHSLAWCADGTLAAWGSNNHGQLGVAGPTQSDVPLAVDVTGFASGDGVGELAAGGNHSLLRLTTGRLAAWGENANGQLGDGSMLARALPTEVSALTGRIMAVASGAAAQHTLALQANPMAPGGTRKVAAAGLIGADLIGYAFQLDPSRPGVTQLPEGRLVDGEYVIRFTQPAAVNDVVYGAEWSETMQPGSWQEVPDTGSGSDHRFAIPATGTLRGFIRLKVSEAAR